MPSRKRNTQVSGDILNAILVWLNIIRNAALYSKPSSHTHRQTHLVPTVNYYCFQRLLCNDCWTRFYVVKRQRNKKSDTYSAHKSCNRNVKSSGKHKMVLFSAIVYLIRTRKASCDSHNSWSYKLYPRDNAAGPCVFFGF